VRLLLERYKSSEKAGMNKKDIRPRRSCYKDSFVTLSKDKK
jgi:hypothetical protein